jgi:hypothetical protein
MALGSTTGTAGVPTLPDLGSGVTLLESSDGSDLTGALQALTLDRLLRAGSPGVTVGYWVGDGRHARTDTLHAVAPAARVLDRLRVGRAFTTDQHLTLLRRLARRLADAEEPVVCTLPALDARYRDGDLPDDDRAIFCRALAELRGLAREHDLPVLVTRYRDDEVARPLDRVADHRLELTTTRFGPRFRNPANDDATTLVYEDGDGWVQTTLAYWRRVLAGRTPLYPAIDRVTRPTEVRS